MHLRPLLLSRPLSAFSTFLQSYSKPIYFPSSTPIIALGSIPGLIPHPSFRFHHVPQPIPHSGPSNARVLGRKERKGRKKGARGHSRVGGTEKQDEERWKVEWKDKRE